MLWTDDLARTYHEPADPSQLSVSFVPTQNQLVIQYDEWSPWRRTIRRRTYLVQRDQTLAGSRRPQFVSSAPVKDAIQIPFCTTNRTGNLSTNADCVCIYSNDQSFTILWHDLGPEGPIKLPRYRGISGSLKVAALTPTTLLLDASLIGGLLAYGAALAISTY
jgi:hypothetical protein